MTATTAERNTSKRATGRELSFAAAAQKLLVGTIAVLNASGFAEMGSTSTTVKALGVVQATVDNSAGAAGDLQVPIERGTWKFFNSSAGDLIANTDYGATCYIVDNQTVAKTNGGATRSVAGVIRGVDADGGVWVEF